MSVSLPIPASATSAATLTSYGDSTGHWAQEAIEHWSGYGVLEGSEGMFYPDQAVTRAELAVILVRMLNYPEIEGLSYKDVQPSDSRLTKGETIDKRYLSYIINMATNGYIKGRPDGTFDSNATVTRAEIVTILNNMADIYFSDAGTYTVSGDQTVFVACGGVELTYVGGDSHPRLYLSPGTDSSGIILNSEEKRFVTVQGRLSYDVPIDTTGNVILPAAFKQIMHGFRVIPGHCWTTYIWQRNSLLDKYSHIGSRQPLHLQLGLWITLSR